MDRGKGSIKPRGKGIQFSFYYKGQRIRATKALNSNIKAQMETARSMMASIQFDITLDKFNLAKYFPDHPLASKFRTSSDITISEQLDSWIKYKQAQLELSTIRDYRSAIDRHLIPAFGDLTLSELTTSQVRNWIHTLDISNQRINNILIPLRAIFSDAYADEVIDRNPMDRIQQLPRRTPEANPFTRDEMKSILSACDGQIQNIFKFAFWTGLRTSELIALSWSDVDLKQKTAYIRHVRTRTGDKDRPKTTSSIRQIELLQPAIEALKLQKPYTYADGGEIFQNPRTGSSWTHDGPLRKTAWKKTLAAAGVPYRKAYNTRHTFASQTLSAGADPMWVAKQMGHKDWGMIRKVYGRWLTDSDNSVSDKISYLWAPNGHKEVISG